MGRRNRGRYERRYERKIEHREWFLSSPASGFDPAQNTNVQLLALPNQALKSDDCTILRTRGHLACQGTGLGNPPLMLRLALGMIVLPAKYASETSTLPNPLTATDSDDWFVWMAGALILEAASATPLYEFQIDSKAMRKMESDSVVKPIVGIQSPITAFGSDDRLSFVGTIRFLVGY